MTNKKIDISVIVPTHNRSDALDLTLKHLASQDFDGSWELIVVNNNSTDDTAIVVANRKRGFPVSLYLVNEASPGPAAARNTGARAANGEFLVFIDNDILTSPDFLSRHYERLIENPGCWILGQFPNLPEQESTVFGRYRKHLHPMVPPTDDIMDFDVITGQGTSMRKADLQRLGGFDEEFFVASGEDRELAIRAMNSNIRILFDPSIIAVHNDWAGTTVRDYCRRQRLYTQTEPLFASKYGDVNPRREMSIKNAPPSFKSDGLKLYVSKQFKCVVGSRIGQSVLINLCEFIERIGPDNRLLWYFYKVAISGAIYRGYNEGLAKLRSASDNIGGSDTASGRTR